MTKSNRRTIRAATKAGGALLFTAAIALGTTTLGYPAIASADPNNGGGTGGTSEWDIGAYDFCMKNHPPLYTIEEELDHHGGAANRRVESGGPTAARRRQGKLARQPTHSGRRRLHLR